MHTSIGQHAASLGDDGYVHPLRHTILLRSIWDGVVPENAFVTAIIIENSRTQLHVIVSTKQFKYSFLFDSLP
jgi:hypothetical protein